MNGLWVCPNNTTHVIVERVVTKEIATIDSIYPQSVVVGYVPWCKKCGCDAIPWDINKVTELP